MENTFSVFGYTPKHFSSEVKQQFEQGIIELEKLKHHADYLHFKRAFEKLAELIDRALNPEENITATQAHALLQRIGIYNYKSGMYITTNFINDKFAERKLSNGGVVYENADLRNEILNLWHISRVALSGGNSVPSRYDRMIYIKKSLIENHADLIKNVGTGKHLWFAIEDAISENKYEKGGTTPVKKITRRHINTLLREKKAFVKGLTDNQAIDEWNDNSYAIKAGLSPKWTKNFFKKNPGYYREYLVSLLVENELTEEEYKKYFAQGGNIKGGYTIKELHSKNKEELVSLYKEKYGIEASHQDYDTIAAALYFGKRIKHLTEKQEEKFKTKKAKGGVHVKSAPPASPASPATPYQPHVPGSKKKGGTLKSKADAIAAELLGTKVPKKYQGEYGKKYGKKSAKTAADKIAGSILKKEQRK